MHELDIDLWKACDYSCVRKFDSQKIHTGDALHSLFCSQLLILHLKNGTDGTVEWTPALLLLPSKHITCEKNLTKHYLYYPALSACEARNNWFICSVIMLFKRSSLVVTRVFNRYNNKI